MSTIILKFVQVIQNQDINCSTQLLDLKKTEIKKPNQNLKKSAINKYLKTKEKSKTRRKILPQETKERSQQRQSSPLRSSPRKDNKTFNRPSKILKKVEFQKSLSN